MVLYSAAAVQAFEIGGTAYGPTPYVISQNSGAYQSVPDFLDTKHPIKTAADADFYLARLRAFARQLDDQSLRLNQESGRGIVPPDFLLDLTIDQMTKTAVPAGSPSPTNTNVRPRNACASATGFGRHTSYWLCRSPIANPNEYVSGWPSQYAPSAPRPFAP